MPCLGRHQQTLDCVRRLIATAGMEHGRDWELRCVVSDAADLPMATQLSELGLTVHLSDARLTYWQAMRHATQRGDAPLIVNLANDLLPGQHWLARAVEAYRDMFGADVGMLGFNGDSHGPEHSCHFLMSRALLNRYGGWPVWYQHNFGDTELCQRAIAENVYAKAPWALLYHNHPYFGGADDAVYAEGRASSDRDHQLFVERRRLGWPTVN